MQTKIFLGYLGFLPFAALTILPWILGETYEEISFQLLVVYGGIIISFLSGIIWGLDSYRPKDLILSISFSISGFFAILFILTALIFSSRLVGYFEQAADGSINPNIISVSYTHLRAHET